MERASAMQTRRFAFIIPEFHQPSSRSRKEVPKQRLLPAFEESLCFQVSQVFREGRGIREGQRARNGAATLGDNQLCDYPAKCLYRQREGAVKPIVYEHALSQ